MGDDTCNKALFVANLSSRVTTQQLSELFEKKGTVGKLDVKTGFAFVFMPKQSEAEAALKKYNNYEWSENDDRPLKVEWAKGNGEVKRREDDRKQAAQNNPCDTLFVVNFDPDTRERDVEQLFEPFGKIERIEMRKNFAFVQFTTVESATEARIAMNGKTVREREITVEYVARDQRRRRSPTRRYRERSRSPRRNRDRSRSPRRDRDRDRSRSPRRDRDRSRSPRRDRERDDRRRR